MKRVYLMNDSIVITDGVRFFATTVDNVFDLLDSNRGSQEGWKNEWTNGVLFECFGIKGLDRELVEEVLLEEVVDWNELLRHSSVFTDSKCEDIDIDIMKSIADIFSESERLIIKSRTKSALQAKKSRGERVGQIPYGYRLAEDGVHLEEDEKEQEVIRFISILRKERRCSIRGIVSILNEEGVPARGKKWHVTTVARILASLKKQ